MSQKPTLKESIQVSDIEIFFAQQIHPDFNATCIRILTISILNDFAINAHKEILSFFRAAEKAIEKIRQ